MISNQQFLSPFWKIFPLKINGADLGFIVPRNGELFFVSEVPREGLFFAKVIDLPEIPKTSARWVPKKTMLECWFDCGVSQFFLKDMHKWYQHRPQIAWSKFF